MGISVFRLIKSILMALALCLIVFLVGYILGALFQIVVNNPLVLLGIFLVGMFGLLVNIIYSVID